MLEEHRCPKNKPPSCRAKILYALSVYIPKAKQILIKEEITANSIEHIAMFNTDDCETAFIQEASVDVQQFCEKGEHAPL